MEQIAACIKSQGAFSNQLSVSLGGLGLDFAICNGDEGEPFGIMSPSKQLYLDRIVQDMIALCRLVESAKAEVIECDQDQDLQSQSSYSAQ